MTEASLMRSSPSCWPCRSPTQTMSFKSGRSSELDELLANGRLIDEMAALPPRPAASTSGDSGADTVPRIALLVPRLRRAIRRARAPRARGARPTAAGATVAALPPLAPVPTTLGVGLELVWESKPLTRRDLTIPDANGTHATGSMNLDKGLLPEEVDHRHYFRDDVFPSLVWTSRSTAVEEAFAKFQLVLKNINYGEFDLRIGHTVSTTSRAYLQKNAMTRLSWGPMRQYIAQADLIGRTLELYRDEADPARFVLEID